MGTSINKGLQNSSLTVAQLAVSEPRALSVFTKFNIDYCCGGHRSLEEACERIGLDHEKIKQEIYASPETNVSYSFDPEQWSSGFLAEFIVEQHHSYVRKSIPELQALLDKVCDVHGTDSEELLYIRENFEELAEELTSHMNKEELVLFPVIKRLEAQNYEDHPLSDAIQSPISAMEHEHVIAGDLVKRIRSLSNNYTAPDFACPTFKITYQKLKEFDHDLMQHIHLENNILFERLKGSKNNNQCVL